MQVGFAAWRMVWVSLGAQGAECCGNLLVFSSYMHDVSFISALKGAFIYVSNGEMFICLFFFVFVFFGLLGEVAISQLSLLEWCHIFKRVAWLGLTFRTQGKINSQRGRCFGVVLLCYLNFHCPYQKWQKNTRIWFGDEFDSIWKGHMILERNLNMDQSKVTGIEFLVVHPFHSLWTRYEK